MFAHEYVGEPTVEIYSVNATYFNTFYCFVGDKIPQNAVCGNVLNVLFGVTALKHLTKILRWLIIIIW